MTPLNLNSSPFVLEGNEEHDDHQHPPPFSANYHIASSSSLSCHYFFNSTQDREEYYRHKLYQPQQHQEDFNYAYGGGSNDVEDKVDSGLKLTLWKTVNPSEIVLENTNSNNNNNQVQWMSSKMKNSDRVGLKITSSGTTKYENHQKQPSSSLETDLSSNSTSNNNSPIRVCADCNTTKTPLWRSGPKGPKSLCNACGIRQRKARRAMAAADANGTAIATELSPMKIKLPYKDKTGKNGHAAQLKKRCKITAGPSNDKKKLGLEDFLINLSKSLAFNQVFPQDEKDAAILLMALSSGLVHG